MRHSESLHRTLGLESPHLALLIGLVSPWWGSQRRWYSLRPGPVFPDKPVFSLQITTSVFFFSLFSLRMENNWPTSLLLTDGY